MSNKKNGLAVWFSSGLFSKLSGLLIILGLAAALLLILETSYKEEARLKRELADWSARLAEGMGERPPSCGDDFERGQIRVHFSALKLIYPVLRALRFVEVDQEGIPMIRMCSETDDKSDPPLYRPLPEDLRSTALGAAEERKAVVAMPAAIG